MFLHFVSFEIRYWLRSWMLWIFLFIIALLIFGATATDQVTIGDALENTFRNAPFVIVIDTEAIDRYESSNQPEQTRIASRIRDIVQHRGVHYEPSGPLNAVEPFVVEIDEGDL